MNGEQGWPKKPTKLRPWTKEDVRTLKTLAREKDQDDGDCTQAEAERRSNVSASIETWRYAEWGSEEASGEISDRTIERRSRLFRRTNC